MSIAIFFSVVILNALTQHTHHTHTTHTHTHTHTRTLSLSKEIGKGFQSPRKMIARNSEEEICRNNDVKHRVVIIFRDRSAKLECVCYVSAVLVVKRYPLLQFHCTILS